MDAITGIAPSDITGYHSSDIKSGLETHTDDPMNNKEVLKGLTFIDSPLGFSGELLMGKIRHFTNLYTFNNNISINSLLYLDSARGRLCLKQYHVIWWRHGRRRRTNSYDICR